jgi:MFS family permease
MCGFSFTVFLSAFQLFPTAPFHIIDLGGSTFASGMFLGFLTYSSAFSAPLTGSYADRIGQRRVLIVCSMALVGFSLLYAVITDYRVLLGLVLVHGVFWSGLLSASASYMTHILPAHRRAEGIGYWGLATLAAVAVAPLVGFWFYRRGWVWLCVVTAALNAIMAGIAYTLEEHRHQAEERPAEGGVIEWRVLVMSITLALYSFGYGGITSFTAMYADANGVQPKSLYLSALAVVILLTRPVFGRLGDRWGYKRVFVPCLVLIVAGLGILALGGTRGWMLASAIVFGVGFGTAYPSYVGYVMQHVSPYRRGAAFGALLAAFDTGIGTGSTTMGWLIQRFDYSVAFGVATACAALAIPYFLTADRYYWRSNVGRVFRPGER